MATKSGRYFAYPLDYSYLCSEYFKHLFRFDAKSDE